MDDYPGNLVLGENWFSLCFSTGGFCPVTVKEEILGESTITFTGTDNTKFRVVDVLGNNDTDVLVCRTTTPVEVRLNQSVGWTTN